MSHISTAAINSTFFPSKQKTVDSAGKNEDLKQSVNDPKSFSIYVYEAAVQSLGSFSRHLSSIEFEFTIGMARHILDYNSVLIQITKSHVKINLYPFSILSIETFFVRTKRILFVLLSHDHFAIKEERGN